jgi:S-ribosylhomocysteine lyase|nr:MAG TPA: S-Ribosylhomocysteinase (LuxS) [Caudoviricetes sp.]
MEKIASFTVDHTVLLPGVYISRVDEDIVTYDIRIKRPNTDDLMSNEEMHSVEHLLATALRNSYLKDDVIYFGPMGCQTGYYCLMRVDSGFNFMKFLKDVMIYALSFDSMPGQSAVECGNYKNLDLELGKSCIKNYLNLLDSFEDICEYPKKLD